MDAVFGGVGDEVVDDEDVAGDVGGGLALGVEGDGSADGVGGPVEGVVGDDDAVCLAADLELEAVGLVVEEVVGDDAAVGGVVDAVAVGADAAPVDRVVVEGGVAAVVVEAVVPDLDVAGGCGAGTGAGDEDALSAGVVDLAVDDLDVAGALDLDPVDTGGSR